MNKTDFIKELTDKTGISIDEALAVNDIIEDTMIIGNKNKDKIVS